MIAHIPEDANGKRLLWERVQRELPDMAHAMLEFRKVFPHAAFSRIEFPNGDLFVRDEPGLRPIHISKVLEHYPGTDEEWEAKNPDLVEQNKRVIEAIREAAKARKRKKR